MRQIVFILTISVFFSSCFKTKQNISQPKTYDQNVGMSTQIPEKVKEIKKTAKKVYKNFKGFWEAEFSIGIIMVYVPPGKFTMGSTKGEDKELPEHVVYLDGYWIGKYPVTVAQFKEFVNATGYLTDSQNGEGSWIEKGGKIRYDVSWTNPGFKQENNHPVVCVSWNDANAFCRWFSLKTGLNSSLPTEAQWEKAARGTDQRLYPWGNRIPDGSQSNFADIHYIQRFGKTGRNPSEHVNDGYAQTSPVNAFPSGQSPYGIFDMAGNTIDWLYDWFGPNYYSRSPLSNPVGPRKNIKRKKTKIPGGWGSNLQRSIRGGAWTDASGELSLAHVRSGHQVFHDSTSPRPFVKYTDLHQ